MAAAKKSGQASAAATPATASERQTVKETVEVPLADLREARHWLIDAKGGKLGIGGMLTALLKVMLEDEILAAKVDEIMFAALQERKAARTRTRDSESALDQ